MQQKSQNISDLEKNMPSIDGLSALPDDILCHILSRLLTKSSVKTSVLSRRWRYLWTHVPILDLEVLNPPPDTLSYKYFKEIVDRFMLLNKAQNIYTFCLALTVHECSIEPDLEWFIDAIREYNEYDLEIFITAAISRNVRNLDLYCDCPTMLPDYLFTCGTLVDLRLHGFSIGARTSGTVCLPSLKKLHLCSVQYNENEYLTELISGCPVLEDLFIDKIFQEDLYRCHISSPTLKWLMINYQFDDTANFEYLNVMEPDDYVVEINCPTLRYLKVENGISENVIFEMPITSLIEADICFDTCFEDDFCHHTSALDFFGSLCNVKYLNLSCGYLEFVDEAFTLSRFGKSTMRFDNLTKLDVAANRFFLEKLLEKADNLEVLIIREVGKDLERWVDPEQVPRCLLLHITSITLHEFDNSKFDFEMVRYLLRNAEVLKKMELYFKSRVIDMYAKRDAQKRISQLQRGSNSCELLFF